MALSPKAENQLEGYGKEYRGAYEDISGKTTVLQKHYMTEKMVRA